MAKHFVKVTEGFQGNFPNEQDWSHIKENFAHAGRALRELFRHLLIGEKYGDLDAVQIFESGIGFRVEETEKPVDAVSELRSILMEAREKCVDEDEEKFLKKLTEPKRQLLKLVWEATQELVARETEADALFAEMAEQMANYAKKWSTAQQTDNSEVDGTKTSTESDSETNKSAEEIEEERIRKKTEEIMKEYGLA